jgi:hypothetical protein
MGVRAALPNGRLWKRRFLAVRRCGNNNDPLLAVPMPRKQAMGADVSVTSWFSRSQSVILAVSVGCQCMGPNLCAAVPVCSMHCIPGQVWCLLWIPLVTDLAVVVQSDVERGTTFDLS